MLEPLFENLDTVRLYYGRNASRCNLTCDFFITNNVSHGYLLLSLSPYVHNPAVHVYKTGGRMTEGRKTKGRMIKGRKTKGRMRKGRMTERRKTKGPKIPNTE
jgi:hypothetical protein